LAKGAFITNAETDFIEFSISIKDGILLKGLNKRLKYDFVWRHKHFWQRINGEMKFTLQLVHHLHPSTPILGSLTVSISETIRLPLSLALHAGKKQKVPSDGSIRGGQGVMFCKVLYGEAPPAVQPLTLLYTTLTEQIPPSYIFYRKKEPLSRTNLRKIQKQNEQKNKQTFLVRISLKRKAGGHFLNIPNFSNWVHFLCTLLDREKLEFLGQILIK